MNTSYSRPALLAWGASLLILGTAALGAAYVGPARGGVLAEQAPGLTWVLGVAGGLLVALGVLLLGGPPWRKGSRPAVRAALWAHGLLGVAGVLLASRLEGAVAVFILSLSGFELVVAVLCARTLHRRGTVARRPVSGMGRLLAVGLAFLLSAAPLAAQDLLIADARLVDPHAEAVRPGALLLCGDTIAAVLDAAPADYDPRVVVLEPSAVVRELPFSAFAPLWSPVEWAGWRELGLAFSAGDIEAAAVAFEVEELARYRDAAPGSP